MSEGDCVGDVQRCDILLADDDPVGGLACVADAVVWEGEIADDLMYS